MLLGREREQRAIEELLAEARAGISGVLALVGEPGIGKSSLVEEAASRAEGMRVLRARAVPSEAQIPFAGLFELLRPALACLDVIPRPQAAALESALALRPARSEDRFAVGAATLSLLAAYAEEQPVAVLVDDAQWLDGSSADALLFAVRRLLAEPIAVVLAAREGQPSLLDGAGLPTLLLPGLDEEASELLLRRENPGAAEHAARLHRETGGNPLALLELARERLPELVPEVPVPVVTSVAARYAQRAQALPERSRDALVLAAATDRGDLTLLARAGERLGVAVTDLDAGQEAGLVVLQEGRVEFRHPLARSAIYAAASAKRRRQIHPALAVTLPDADADRRAWHLAVAAAGPDETASAAVAQAARRARERSAYDVASQAFERAARLATTDERRAQLLHDGAEAAWFGGLADRTVALLDEAERIAAGSGVELDLAYLRGQILLRRGPLSAARELLRVAERAEPERAALFLSEAVYGAFWTADASWMRECADRARDLAARAGSRRIAFLTSTVAGIAAVFFGERDVGASLRAAAGVYESTQELREDPRLLALAAVPQLWLRESAVGHDAVDRSLDTARALAVVGVLPLLLEHLGIVQAATDRWVEAQASFDEAIELARETGQRTVLAAALSRLALLEARLGREDACRAHAEEAQRLARELGATQCELWALAALADLELAIGSLEAALARCEQVEELLRRNGIADADLSPVPEQIEALLRLGRGDDAAAVLDSFVLAAESKGQPWARARAARCRGLLAPDGVFEEAFEDALVLHAATPDLFEAARTELAYGARLRRAGRRAAARERLRAAIESFDALDAAPWSELARAELAATGETARRRDPSTLDQLTPQELHVSLLLAEGKTTKEAAAALFLSPKTIEYHLRNAYRKLAIHSREELRETLRHQRALARD
jgi:DNA-binding CsgD family transcriptional regulator